MLDHVGGKEKVFPKGIQRRTHRQIETDQAGDEPESVPVGVGQGGANRLAVGSDCNRVGPSDRKQTANKRRFRMPMGKVDGGIGHKDRSLASGLGGYWFSVQ